MPQVVPPRKRDEHSGRFEEEYPPEDVIAVIQQHGGEAGTSDVAEGIGTSPGTARYKLKVMEEQGYVESRKIGGVRIWRVTNNENE
jgi:Mn-dependent DtxR family transcriptional regulator